MDLKTFTFNTETLPEFCFLFIIFFPCFGILNYFCAVTNLPYFFFTYYHVNVLQNSVAGQEINDGATSLALKILENKYRRVFNFKKIYNEIAVVDFMFRSIFIISYMKRKMVFERRKHII